jgi:hypothetical protein
MTLLSDNIGDWTPDKLWKFISNRLASDASLIPSPQRAIKAAFEIEPWTLVTTFTNGWTNFDTTGGWQPARYCKDAQGIVHVQGLVKSGTPGTAIFQLPAGYRPEQSLMFATIDGANTARRLDVNQNGTIIPDATVNNGFVTISLTFRPL